jgi:hypothetical protein
MNNLNPAELAAFSEFVYRDTADTSNYPARLPAGFIRLQVNSTTANGFYASAFRNSSTGQVVIAFRGTDDFLDWLKNNPSFKTGVIPPQFDQALQFVNSVMTFA